MTKTIRVTTIEDAPHIFVKKDANGQPTGEYSGFCNSLVNKIADQFERYPDLFGSQKFKFEIHLVADGKYGRKVPCGNKTVLDSNGNKVEECWDGMIGEL